VVSRPSATSIGLGPDARGDEAWYCSRGLVQQELGSGAESQVQLLGALHLGRMLVGMPSWPRNDAVSILSGICVAGGRRSTVPRLSDRKVISTATAGRYPYRLIDTPSRSVGHVTPAFPGPGDHQPANRMPAAREGISMSTTSGSSRTHGQTGSCFAVWYSRSWCADGVRRQVQRSQHCHPPGQHPDRPGPVDPFQRSASPASPDKP
jgi:hypothetical protein